MAATAAPTISSLGNRCSFGVGDMLRHGHLSVPGNGVLTVSSGGMTIGPEPTAGS